MYWRGDPDMESFSLKCRNEEQLKQWKSTLERLLSDCSNKQTASINTLKDSESIAPVKRTAVSNTQLASLQNLDIPSYSRRDDDAASFIDEEDEDEEEEEEEIDDWNNHNNAKIKSQSLPYGQFPSPAHNGRARSRTEDGSQYNLNSSSPPPPPNIPNMHLQHRTHANVSMPPLSRNGTNTATPTTATFPSSAIMGENSGYYSNSPPQSYPDSPAQSTRSSTSTAHSNSMNTWKRRSIEHPSPLADTIAKFMLAEDDEYMAPPPIMQRAHSHSAAAGQTFQQAIGTLPSTLQPSAQSSLTQPNSTQSNSAQHPPVGNRMRSQSSPNIQAIQEWEGPDPLPDLPSSTNAVRSIVSNVFHSTGTQQRDSGSSTSSRTSVQSVTNAAPSPPNGHQHSLSNFSTTMKIKVNYADDIFVIVVPQDIEYRELCDRVERKIRLCSTRRDESIPIRIKYQDEDGDYITINSDEDVLMAFEGRLAAGGNFVNLYVS